MSDIFELIPESSRRTPQQQRSRARLERIFDAAAAVFGEVGYDPATTHQIAERAQTAVGTLYRFFPDKRALFLALEERHMARVLDFQNRMLTPELVKLPLEQMVAHLVEHSAAFLGEPTARVMYLLYYTTPQLFQRFDDAFISQMITQAGQLLQARNPTLATETTQLVAEVFIQSFNHLILVALRQPEPRRHTLIQEMKVLLVAYLRQYEFQKESIPAALAERHRAILKQVVEYRSLTLQRLGALFAGTSRRTLQRDLAELVSQGWLTASGSTNQRTYHPTEKLQPNNSSL